MSRRSASNKENDWPQQRQSATEEPGCKYHPGKKAKYKIVNVPYQGGRSKYSLCDQVCSKCAVSLVALGYKVEETMLDVQQQRQEEIQQFLYQIQGCFQALDQAESSLIEKRSDLMRFCEKQRARVKEYYQKLIITLENRMNEQIYTLNEAQSQLEETYEFRHQELKEQHTDLLQMYSDIEVNLESILTQIDQLPYRQVMGQYQKRIQQSLQHIGRLDQTQVGLVKVQLKRPANQEPVMGGLFEDSELEVKAVQTGLLKRCADETNSQLSPSPSTGFTSQIATPPKPEQLNKQRSLSQPTYGAQKYLDILNRVNENQLKTNDYYTTLMQHRKQSHIEYLSDSSNSHTLISVPCSRGSPVEPNRPSPKFK